MLIDVSADYWTIHGWAEILGRAVSADFAPALVVVFAVVVVVAAAPSVVFAFEPVVFLPD